MLFSCVEAINAEYVLFDGDKLNITKSINPKAGLICYDFLNLKNFDGFAYDVKVIHKLLGHKFLNFEELISLFCDKEKIDIYIGLRNCIAANIKSYKIAKIDISKFGICETISEDLVKRFYSIRLSLIQDLYTKAYSNNNFDSVMCFYEHFFRFMKTIKKVQERPIRIKLENILDKTNNWFNFIEEHTREGYAKLDFDIVGTKNGRLAHKKKTFNIFTLPKEFRKAIVADEDCVICHIDYVAFQPRIAIFLSDNKSLKEKVEQIDDLYSIFEGARDENKIALISWMYSGNAQNEQFNNKLSAILQLRQTIYSEALKHGSVKNIHERPL